MKTAFPKPLRFQPLLVGPTWSCSRRWGKKSLSSYSSRYGCNFALRVTLPGEVPATHRTSWGYSMKESFTYYHQTVLSKPLDCAVGTWHLLPFETSFRFIVLHRGLPDREARTSFLISQHVTRVSMHPKPTLKSYFPVRLGKGFPLEITGHGKLT